MRAYRLAQLFEARYGLIARASDSPAQSVLDAIKDIKIGNRMWMVNKDQSIAWWANQGYQTAESFKKTIDEISSGDMKYFSPSVLFMAVNHALGLLTRMRHGPASLGDFKERMMSPGITRKDVPDEEYANTRVSKAEGAMRMLSSILEKSAKSLQAAYPELRQYALLGGYELQKPRPLSKKQILDFLRFHPEAATYGLTPTTMEKLIQSDIRMFFPEEKEAVRKLIHTVKSGKTPKDGPAIFQKTKEIMGRLEAQKPGEVHDPLVEMPEEVAQESYKEQIGGPSIGESLTRLKQEKADARKIEEEAEKERLRMLPFLAKRDREHAARQQAMKQQRLDEEIQRKKTEEELINKYNSLSFDQWIRS